MSYQIPFRPPGKKQIVTRNRAIPCEQWGYSLYGNSLNGTTYRLHNHKGPNGEPIEVVVNNYVDGELNGWQITYVNNCRVKASYYKDGVWTKKLVFSRKNPTIVVLEKSRTADGRMHGRYRERYESGGLLVDANFRNNKLHGRLTFYTEDGLRIESYRVRNGYLDGLAYHYNTDGELEYQWTMKRGFTKGWSYRFEKGKPVGHAQYNKRGALETWVNHKKTEAVGAFLKVFREIIQQKIPVTFGQALCQAPSELPDTEEEFYQAFEPPF